MPKLIGANNTSLKSVGTTLAKVQIKIGKLIQEATVLLIIIEDLCGDMLLGLEAMEKLHVDIKVKERKLLFNKDDVRRGVYVNCPTVIQARSQTTVSANVHSVGTIMILPFQINNEILVANSINEIRENKVELVVANPNKIPIKLESKMQLASFEPVEQENTTIDYKVQRIAKLTETNIDIRIGDKLTTPQERES